MDRRLRASRTPAATSMVLGTVAWGCAALLASCSSPSIPPTWKPVAYLGIAMDIPPSWPVYQRSERPCGISGPGVLVGPPSHITIFCPLVVQHGVVLTLGGPDVVTPVGPEHRLTSNGVVMAISTRTSAAGTVHDRLWTSEEVVRFPGRGVWLSADAPGKQSAGVLAVVDEIVSTIRSVRRPGTLD